MSSPSFPHLLKRASHEGPWFSMQEASAGLAINGFVSGSTSPMASLFSFPCRCDWGGESLKPVKWKSFYVLIIFIFCFCDMYTSQVKAFFFRHMSTSQVKACDDVMESSRLHLRCSLYSKQWPQFVTIWHHLALQHTSSSQPAQFGVWPERERPTPRDQARGRRLASAALQDTCCCCVSICTFVQ